jgi:hypothetical protein
MEASASGVNRCPRLSVAHRRQCVSDDGHGAGERTQLFFRRDRQELKRSGRFSLGVCDVDDGQRNTDLPLLVRSLLDGIEKDRTVWHDDRVAQELKFLTVESHLILLGEA